MNNFKLGKRVQYDVYVRRYDTQTSSYKDIPAKHAYYVDNNPFSFELVIAGDCKSGWDIVEPITGRAATRTKSDTRREALLQLKDCMEYAVNSIGSIKEVNRFVKKQQSEVVPL